MNKVILISIDGMRPDGLLGCGNPYVRELEKLCAYNYASRSVIPSVTLPCHFSMTHSVTPQRHGILTNTYVPQVRPVDGIFEKVKAAGGVTAMFYGWEPLRDIVSPGTLKFSSFIYWGMRESCDPILTDRALECIAQDKPDFVFLYLADTDERGHGFGWMSQEYLRALSIAIDQVKRVIETCGDEYTVVIMADHGGHERHHGTDLPEDMTVPLFLKGEGFTPGEIGHPTSLLDIAPTIAKVMGIPLDPDWEGEAIGALPVADEAT